jgi:hypothetical protein
VIGRVDIIINGIKSCSLSGLLCLDGLEFFGTALGVVEQNVGKLGNGDTISLVDDVLRVAGGTGAVGVEGLAERVD